MKCLKPPKGFTLVELMVVIVIVGILSALALVSFLNVTPKSRQSEAKLILKQIYVNQMAHRQAHDAYFVPVGPAHATATDMLKPLYVEIGTTAFYTYTVVGNAVSFTATATCGVLDEDVDIDVWQIDEKGQLVCLANDAL